MAKEEMWRDIRGHEDCYQVSTDWRVRSLCRTTQHDSFTARREGRILGQVEGGGGWVALSKNGRVERRKVATLVAEAFGVVEALNEKAA